MNLVFNKGFGRNPAFRNVLIAAVGAGVSAVVLILYLATLAPGVLPYELPELADTSMLQMQVCTLSMTHPTGYPTYLMLSHLVTYLPFGDCAFRSNLASALFAALAAGALYFTAMLITRRVIAAAVGALAFGFGTTLWSQAVIAEVYAMNAFFVVLAVGALFLWREKRRDGYLMVAALCVGLSVTNHMTSALLLPAALLFVLVVEPRKLLEWKVVLGAAGAFVAGLLPYLYLPLRSPSAPMKTNDPDSFGRFWLMVSGGDLRGGFFAFGPSEIPARLSFYGGYLLDNFGWLLLSAAAVGFAAMLIWDRGAAALTGFLYAGWTFHAIENDIVDVEIYFITSYIIVALWVCFGVSLLLDEAAAATANLSRSVRVGAATVLCTVLLLLPFAVVPDAYAANDRSGDVRGDAILDSVAENAPQDATVLHLRSSLWYMVLVEKRRTDLTLVDPFQGWEGGRYNDVVWPYDLTTSEKRERFGIGDPTGVTAAIKAVNRGEPVYLLAHEGLDLDRFRRAGFEVTNVEGSFYRLSPAASGGRS